MAGLGIKVYTDEDVDVNLPSALRNAGYDALSCREAGNHNQGLTDEFQLRFARDHGRAIIVHNTLDYRRLSAQLRDRGEEHFGIISINQAGSAELIRRIRRHLDLIHPEQQFNRMIATAP
jgi:predicted nuclease of predicted toxin-antitoxin system